MDRPLYMVDTNVLVAYARSRGAVFEAVEKALKLSENPPLISVVSKGEMLALAKLWKWEAKRLARVHELLASMVVVDIADDRVLNAYSEIRVHCEQGVKPAHKIPQNDAWIAATASVASATLITADSHFDHLTPKFISRIHVDATTGKLRN